MGCVDTITATAFPKQGTHTGQRAKVCFHYDTERWLYGSIVRDDMEAPWVTIIRLDDGRTVLGTECQYTPLP